MGQNLSKKKVQGCGSYLTKYGLTIYFLDPFEDMGHLEEDPQG